jgi:hypothetical protein
VIHPRYELGTSGTQVYSFVSTWTQQPLNYFRRHQNCTRILQGLDHKTEFVSWDQQHSVQLINSVFIWDLRFSRRTLMNAVFWDVTPWSCCYVSKGRITSIITVEGISELETTLAVTSNWSTLLILSTVKMEAICSFKTSVLTRATRRHIPEDGILFSVYF